MNYKSKYTEDYGNVYTVYIHICPNGKRYVGITRQDVRQRWHGGKGYKNQKAFYEDIEQFGWENIKHEIILKNVNLETAGRAEQELIKKYNTQNPDYGYNTKNGGQTFGEHSKEFLENLKERMAGNTYCVGRKISKEHINAMREGRTEETYRRESGIFHHSESTKKELSDIAKKRWEDDDYRRKMIESHAAMTGENNPMFGKKHTQEAKQKISEKAKMRTVSEETKRKMSESSTIKRKVAQFDLNGSKISEFSSCKEAAKSVNGNSTNISFACRNKGRTYKGYEWRYVNDNTRGHKTAGE